MAEFRQEAGPFCIVKWPSLFNHILKSLTLNQSFIWKWKQYFTIICGNNMIQNGPHSRRKKWLSARHWAGYQNPEPFVWFVLIGQVPHIYLQHTEHLYWIWNWSRFRNIGADFRNLLNWNKPNKGFRILASHPVYMNLNIESLKKNTPRCIYCRVPPL